MILGMEIAMLVIGFLALIRGKMTISGTKVVEGAPARLLGLLAMSPLPLAFGAVLAYVAMEAPADPERFVAENHWTIIGIEAAIVIGVAILVFGIGAMVATDPNAKRRKRRDDADYDDGRDEYGEPRRPWER